MKWVVVVEAEDGSLSVKGMFASNTAADSWAGSQAGDLSASYHPLPVESPEE